MRKTEVINADDNEEDQSLWSASSYASESDKEEDMKFNEIHSDCGNAEVIKRSNK